LGSNSTKQLTAILCSTAINYDYDYDYDYDYYYL
jgi:hypothetical protein